LTDYELYAVIVHYGPTVFGGHYICFVKVDDVWYLFDDTKVTEVSPSVVLSQNAYMLFYQKTVQVENSSMKAKMRNIEKV
jgi:ubiquitin C-terminal hydrolase